MRRVFQFATFPLTLVLVVLGSTLALRRGVDPSQLPAVATALTLAVVLLAERWLPRVGRAAEPDERQSDFAFVGLSTIVDAATHAGLAAAMTTATVALAEVSSYSAVAADLPLALGVIGVLLVSGMGDYWAHRLGHTWRWWWRLHAVHHAPRRMVALNNFRLHPADLALKLVAATAPVLLLGFPPEAIAIAGTIKGLNIAFQHADVDLRHGWLNWVFATNSVHRWHHSADPHQANANYGGVLSVFDLLFGTYRVPAEHEEPERMGLFHEAHYPVHEVLRSTIAPLCWRRCVELARSVRPCCSRCCP